MVKIQVPASTSNLGSGFDSIGMALQLYLFVEMRVIPQGLQIFISGEGCSDIPTNEDNLIYKSAQTFYKKIGKDVPGLEIKIETQIPLFRGLGSSGAATVAGIMCASKLSNTELSAPEILSLVNEIEGHPENAASSLFGGLTINCVENGKVITRKVEVDEKIKTVLLIPDLTISTNKARSELPDTVPHQDAVFNLQRSAMLVYAFISRDYDILKTAMQDKLHQPFRGKSIAGYHEFEKAGYQNGALGVYISGSGSTIAGLTKGDGKQLQNSWITKSRELNIKARVLIAEIEKQGANFI